MKLQFTSAALCDLDRLKAFIFIHNPNAADKMLARLLYAIDHLRDHGYLGRITDGLPSYRELIAGQYLVRYTVDDRMITVLRICHQKEGRGTRSCSARALQMFHTGGRRSGAMMGYNDGSKQSEQWWMRW